jgi:hypothetical protein
MRRARSADLAHAFVSQARTERAPRTDALTAKAARPRDGRGMKLDDEAFDANQSDREAG